MGVWGKEMSVVATSMVGRILAHWKQRGVLHEPPRPEALRLVRRKLRNRPWAMRKPKYWLIQQPGDLVEIDTKEVRRGAGEIFKQFGARCVVSRGDVVEAHHRATPLPAARFPEGPPERMPVPMPRFPAGSGSEFAS